MRSQAGAFQVTWSMVSAGVLELREGFLPSNCKCWDAVEDVGKTSDRWVVLS